MGGDDLCSDDEFLNPSLQDFPKETQVVEVTEEVEQAGSKRKRKGDNHINELTTKKSCMKMLINTSRGVEKQAPDVQATFLWTVMKHYVQLKGDTISSDMKIEDFHLRTSKADSLLHRLKDIISMKKLKKWKPIGSPMVLILCISARRSVAVLKELSGLKIRAAKLFAKHMSVDQQRDMLKDQAFGMAVGTPNRIQVLCEDEGEGKAPLYLGKTTHVIIDSHVNQKGYTVCTLPDTAPDTMDFLKQRVVPELKKRRDIKISFL